MPSTKLCRKCNEVKPVDQFHKNQGKKDGLRPECAKCHTAYMVQWQRENKKSVRARNERWMAKVVNGETNRQRVQRISRDNAKKNKTWLQYKYPERQREWRRARTLAKFGITAEQYDALVAAQSNRCAICGSDNPGFWGESKVVRRWNIDHCHNTKIVRGLLCSPCNFAIHKLERDLEWGIKAVAYLQNPPAISVLS